MFTTTATFVHKYDSPSKIVNFVQFKVAEKFTFQEGQFVMIESEINGETIKRAYSIATTNKQLQEQGIIGFVIKKVSAKGMSNYLSQDIALGDTIQIKGPLGHYINNKTHPHYLFIAVGSGLSPNLALFQHLAYESHDYKQIVNIYGERYMSHIIPEVEDLFTQHKQENIHNFFHLSKENTLPPKYKNGHVQESLNKAIKMLGTETSCFICGLPAMVDEVREKLQALGINKEYITFEKY